jgi:SAM-dependent methyltransferase
MSLVLDRIKMEYLHPLLPPSGVTLEVGAGSGRLSCWIGQSGYRTLCVDYAAQALQAAKANYTEKRVRGSLIRGDGFRLPLQDGSCDVVLSTGLLEHFADPSPIVCEMVRVLRPGGLFYSDIVPRKFSLFRSLEWLGRWKQHMTGADNFVLPLFERSFSGEEIRLLLGQARLENIHVFAAGVVPPYLPLLSRSDWGRSLQVRFVEQTRAFWQAWDHTRIAEWLGFYYFATGHKPTAAAAVDRIAA